jgi:hypothetical protein
MAGTDWAVKAVFSAKDMISNAVKNAGASMGRFEDQTRKSLEGAGKEADGFIAKMKSIGQIAAGVALGNLITKGVNLGLNALTRLKDSLPEYTGRIDTLAKIAQKVGLSAESFQKLNWAAELSDVSTEKLSGAFNALNKNLGSGALVKYLAETDRALYDQVKAARSNEEVFYRMADAIGGEQDIARRAALGNAVFGKSWADLVPMIADGSEAVKEAAASIPDLASSSAIARAQTWNDTWTEITRSIRGFADVLREAAVTHLLPYVQVVKEWIAENRELVKQKIAEYVKRVVGFVREAVTFVRDLIPKIKTVMGIFERWGPAIAVMGGAAAVFFGVVNAVNAVSNAVKIAKGAFALLNTVMSANPAALIMMAVIAAVYLLKAGFELLMEKVGGLGPALEVVKNTIFKALLTPFNMVLDVVQGLMFALGKIPGLDWAKEASEAIGGFQDKINQALTGSTATLLEGGVKGAVEGYRDGGVMGAVGGGLAGAAKNHTEPYQQARERYLAEHPEAAGTPPAEDSKWAALLEQFKSQNATLGTIADNTGATADGVDNLGRETSGPAKSLNYGLAGIGDIWSITRAGL